MAQLFWSYCCILFLTVSYRGSGRWANSCTSTGIFFLLQFCKSGSLKTYMYMCIKYMYIKIMLFKYLHIKLRDWLLSQNYWNYLPQEHLDLKNLYNNTFLLKLNNLWNEWLALHPLLFIWVVYLEVMERPLCMSNMFPVNDDKILFCRSFPPQFLIGLPYGRAFMRETLAQWEYFCHCSRAGIIDDVRWRLLCGECKENLDYNIRMLQSAEVNKVRRNTGYNGD